MVPGHGYIGASIVGDCHRWNPVHRRFSCRGEGAADQQISSQVCPRVDARDDQIDLGRNRRQGGTNAINRRSIHREPVSPWLMELKRPAGRHAVTTLTAASVRCDDDDLCRTVKRPGDGREQRLETISFDSVVIGQKYLQGMIDIVGLVVGSCGRNARVAGFLC